MKLICGDCYEEIKKIPDNSVDLVYIDIPYLFETGGDGSSQLSHRIKHTMKNELKALRNGIDYSIFDELCRVLKHIYIYIWCSKEQIFDVMKYFVDEKQCRYNILVWCKTNPTPATNGNWLPDIEYCLCFKAENTPKYNDGYSIKSKWYISPINKKDKDLYQHPTIKPLELVERHLKHSTKEGDVVLDCFMGSGTTGVACRNLNRDFIGIEINPEYFQIRKNRIENQVQQLGMEL